MKNLLILLVLLFATKLGIAQDTIQKSENLSNLGDIMELDSIQKGGLIELSFDTMNNENVVLFVYDENGKMIGSNFIEVYSDMGIALATRSFEPGVYYLNLQLNTGNQAYKVKIFK